MSPRNYFSRDSKSPYFVSDIESKDTAELEKKVEAVLRSIITIPRRFWAGIKRAIWPS